MSAWYIWDRIDASRMARDLDGFIDRMHHHILTLKDESMVEKTFVTLIKLNLVDLSP